jgi:V/A-type H+-transporting ATPase subunit K
MKSTVLVRSRWIRGICAGAGTFILLSTLLYLLLPEASAAEQVGNVVNARDQPHWGIYMAAALATGLSCIAAGIAVGQVGASAIAAISEKPELLGRTLIILGLAEGIAIYGLIISFLILAAI